MAEQPISSLRDNLEATIAELEPIVHQAHGQSQELLGLIKSARERMCEADSFEHETSDKLSAVLKQEGISLDAAFSALFPELVDWVRTHLDQDSLLGREIASLVFAHTQSVQPGKLPVGDYQNPHTEEWQTKVKRNSQKLDRWIYEYGLETVKSWRVGDPADEGMPEGLYKNPASGERVERKRANSPVLCDWVRRHGRTKVAGWRIS